MHSSVVKLDKKLEMLQSFASIRIATYHTVLENQKLHRYLPEQIGTKDV